MSFLRAINAIIHLTARDSESAQSAEEDEPLFPPDWYPSVSNLSATVDLMSEMRGETLEAVFALMRIGMDCSSSTKMTSSTLSRKIRANKTAFPDNEWILQRLRIAALPDYLRRGIDHATRSNIDLEQCFQTYVAESRSRG